MRRSRVSREFGGHLWMIAICVLVPTGGSACTARTDSEDWETEGSRRVWEVSLDTATIAWRVGGVLQPDELLGPVRVAIIGDMVVLADPSTPVIVALDVGNVQYAFVADQVMRELDSEDILLSNWDGEAPIIPLVRDILARENDLIGDQRGRILWYIGYEYLTAERSDTR